MNDLQANKAIERLKVIEAEKQILRSKFNEASEGLEMEAEEIKAQLKEFYYSLPQEGLEETKTLKFYKVGDSKLQEKIQEPEYIRDEKKLISWANTMPEYDWMIQEKTTYSFDWSRR